MQPVPTRDGIALHGQESPLSVAVRNVLNHPSDDDSPAPSRSRVTVVRYKALDLPLGLCAFLLDEGRVSPDGYVSVYPDLTFVVEDEYRLHIVDCEPTQSDALLPGDKLFARLAQVGALRCWVMYINFPCAYVIYLAFACRTRISSSPFAQLSP